MQIVIKGRKFCKSCDQTLDMSNFSRNKNTTDGMSFYCKSCSTQKSKDYNVRYKYKVKEYQARWYQNNREKSLKQNKERWERDRINCLNYYSNNNPKCACCGEKEFNFLAIDHINGGGNKQRKIIGGNLVRWIKKNNYPEGFRILCHNCNHSIGMRGFCPHNNL